MVFRQALTAMLIGFVALCPILHLGQACGSAGCVEAESHDRHGHSHDEPAHEDGSVPEQDCFCDGATLVTVVRTGIEMDGDSVEGPILTSQQVGAWFVFAAFSSAADAFARGCHFPPGLSGRDICALKSLRLI